MSNKSSNSSRLEDRRNDSARNAAKTLLNNYLLGHDDYCCTYNNVPVDMLENGLIYDLMSGFGANYLTSVDLMQVVSSEYNYQGGTLLKLFGTAYLLWEDLYPKSNEKIWPKDDDNLKKEQTANLGKALTLRDTEAGVKLNERNHLPLYKKASWEYTEWDLSKFIDAIRCHCCYSANLTCWYAIISQTATSSMFARAY